MTRQYAEFFFYIYIYIITLVFQFPFEYAQASKVFDLNFQCRDFATFNFVGKCVGECETSNITSPALTKSCTTKSMNHVWAKLTNGCPNIAAFYAADNLTNFRTGGGANIISNVVSTIGVPGVASLAFDANSTYGISIQSMGNDTADKWLADHPTFDLSTTMSLQDNAFSAAVLFPRIIEFADPSHDAIFNPYAIVPLSTYEFGVEGSSAFWLPVDTTVRSVDNAKLVLMNATTSDGVFSAIFESSTKVLSLQDGIIRTPTSTKITIAIRNYPYKGLKSKLALEMVVINGNQGIQDLFTEKTHYIGIKGKRNNGFFSWNSYAEENSMSIPVSLSEWTPMLAKDALLRSVYSLAINTKNISLLSNYSARRSFAVFNVENSQSIVWDPILGIGSDINEEDNFSSHLAENALVIMAVAVFFAIIIGIIQTRRHRQRYGSDDDTYKVLLPE